MELNWAIIIFFVLLVDSIGAVVLAFKGPLWWPKYFAPFSNWFPLAKGWALLYLVLVLVIGYYMGVIG